MAWLSFGILTVPHLSHYVRDVLGWDSGQDQAHPVEEIHWVMAIRMFSYGSPAIGGFVVVAQMLNAYGKCVKV